MSWWLQTAEWPDIIAVSFAAAVVLLAAIGPFIGLKKRLRKPVSTRVWTAALCLLVLVFLFFAAMIS